ncbi:DUF2934 domain-containing protein [Neorhizobium sp. P12A]|jgi:hypothetical protein|uniref:DUF2934 domain-containing protein n=1 Tax=Rhizobium/Agrobacterium group TaxID=227290 RepID=UPI00104B563E|nr:MULTISPECIES: DUF2934 domain-containing protein [Rhizobium/Agrobacterium group]KAA0692577.1 DUF2934 domain-containing protein [Neorhizobium sp. P12A]TCR82426.1 DUF2934 family protein [Rhizobium sp. BK376]
MTESRDEWIKKRAYAIWEEEGYPTGRDAAHWEQASKERASVEKTSPHGIEVKPKAKRKTAPKVAVGSNGAAAAVTQAVAAKRAPRKAPAAKV